MQAADIKNYALNMTVHNFSKVLSNRVLRLHLLQCTLQSGRQITSNHEAEQRSSARDHPSARRRDERDAHLSRHLFGEHPQR
jgi:hypothetical protein